MYRNFKVLQAGLLLIIFLVFASVACLFNSYITVINTNPLKNIKVQVVEPVYTNSYEIVWAGTYDRDVRCRLLTFKLYLTNKESGDVIMLGPQHLTRTPKPNLEPGTNIPINFALKTPTNIYAGVWSSLFDAKYVCQHGIFQQVIHVEDPVDSFTVIES